MIVLLRITMLIQSLGECVVIQLTRLSKLTDTYKILQILHTFCNDLLPTTD